ncbi:DUF192 domain-containing protein [Solilutibacter tolerans]|uniref:DUF192 domain-containing protein n=1 Tax=Solilutibacter tolerans TaxID=1604334 RepID=UPI0009714D45|nr:DUF192 domain-containing protein [Lysobacter tolerans]
MKPGIIHREDGSVAVPSAWLADGWWTRLRGLLFRAPLRVEGPEGLLIRPCASVHTMWMRYPLDVLFLDRAGQVCGWRSSVKPWRTVGCRGAFATLELRAGALASIHPRMGETWRWQSDAEPAVSGGEEL